jgi:D-beta-D-heptose 7-phosphate kinase / D-beta-D-heptose 1-phosphate adenosyltransferase
LRGGKAFAVRSLSSLLANLADERIVVVGDAVLDAWLSGPADRLCREAPVPVVTVDRRVTAPGGAANTAANAAALGADVTFVSFVGEDDDAAALRAALAAHGVGDSALLEVPGRRTQAKRRILVDGQVLARFDEGDTGEPTEQVQQDLADALALALAAPDGGVDARVVLVADYGAGTLSVRVRERLSALRDEHDLLLVVDAHDVRSWRDVRPTAVTPNWQEAADLLGISAGVADRAACIEEHADALLAASGASVVVVTLDEDGAVLLEHDRPPYRAYTARVDRPAATGAGDSFAAAFTLALGAGADAITAVEIGVAAASVVVRERGTAVCDIAELQRSLGLVERALLTEAELAAAVAAHREAGRRIVFTNGCFDVLHRGHVAYLEQAKRLGDVLVLALNSDSSVRRLKGTDRPVNGAEDRAAVLAALSCVDHLAVFDEDSPRRLLELVRPDLYVKGGDYTPQMLPEAPLVEQLGGSVRILPYVEDRSTSGILERIRATPPPLSRGS